MKIYNTYVLPKLSYCSQMWHMGRETHLRSIVKEMEKYWNLSLSKSPPENYLWPKEQLIMNDLVLMHKIYHGKLVLKFESLFTMSTKNTRHNSGEIIENYLCNGKFTRYRFSHRIIKYWSMLPQSVRQLSIPKFKTEINKGILRETQKFLNIGLDCDIVDCHDDVE
jgi:hypothetical protein